MVGVCERGGIGKGGWGLREGEKLGGGLHVIHRNFFMECQSYNNPATKWIPLLGPQLSAGETH